MLTYSNARVFGILIKITKINLDKKLNNTDWLLSGICVDLVDKTWRNKKGKRKQHNNNFKLIQLTLRLQRFIVWLF